MRTLFKNAYVYAEGVLLRSAFLCVDGKRVASVGMIRPSGSFDREIDMAGKLLMPGLVNAHCHIPMTLFRGAAEELPLDRWLGEKIFPLENRLTEKQVALGARLGMAELIAGGVTSFSDMYFMEHMVAEEAAACGIKCNLASALFGFEKGVPTERMACVKNHFALYKAYHGYDDGRLLVDASVHAVYTSTPELVREFVSLVKDSGVSMHVHLSETAKEHEECKSTYGKTPAELLESTGLFEMKTLAAHCVMVEPADIALFKKYGVTPVHNPTSNLKLGSGVAPVAEMLKAGVSVALGTDGAASNNNLNMFEEMNLSTLLQKGTLHDPTILPAKQVLRMATLAGALAQQRPDTGEIRVGNRADLTAVNLDTPHSYPNLDPLSTLLYAAQASDVCLTMVDGRVLYENGEYKTIDIERLKADINEQLGPLLSGDREE